MAQSRPKPARVASIAHDGKLRGELPALLPRFVERLNQRLL